MAQTTEALTHYEIYYQTKGTFTWDFYGRFNPMKVVNRVFDEETQTEKETQFEKLEFGVSHIAEPVASFMTNTEWDAYKIMQNIDDDHCYPSKIGVRSMMTGDIVKNVETNKWSILRAHGFDEINVANYEFKKD